MRWRLPYRAWLLIVLGVLLVLSSIRPPHIFDFIIEHALTVAFVALLYIADRKRPISNTSATLLFLYMLLHFLGARYTYSEVPYDRWSENLFGTSLTDAFNLRRNHYDRLVHFLFGVLMVYPMYEFLDRWIPEVRAGRRLIIAVLIIAFLSKLYELLECLYSIVLSNTDAARYNGEQGDRYDAQKDMALALIGAIGSGIVIHFLYRRRSKKNAQSAPEGQMSAQ